MQREIKSNDLGKKLENDLKDTLTKRGSVFWRLHTIRSCRGISNPCDFIVLDNMFTALIECKATIDEKFSCSTVRQLKHFEKSAPHHHQGIYGIIIYFYAGKDGCESKYVFLTDKKVIENRDKRRPVRPWCEDTYNIMEDSLDDLLDELWLADLY